MQISDSLIAANPQYNASVHASAGSGKTWLLITRIIRLLIHNNNPSNIVALTFTRKAAAEMQTRLYERTRVLALAEEAEIKQYLIEMGLSPSSEQIIKTRELYELLLHSRYPIRITTFHAFCQEILLRFPLEAEIPPEFELLDSVVLLETEAWEALYQQAHSTSDSELANALDYLFKECNSLQSTTALIKKFLDARIDWWAYTQEQQNPQQYAIEKIAKKLSLKINSIPSDSIQAERDQIENFLTTIYCQKLKDYAVLLSRHDKKNEKARAVAALKASDPQITTESRLQACSKALLVKSTGNPFTPTSTLLKSVGPKDQERFQSLLQALSDDLLDFHKQIAIHNTLRLSRAWIIAGNQLLHKFQLLKQQRRILDFSDLEWKACQLLNHGDNAQWIQYKLDQRIDHLLIDEFQDTNPTQWKMLAPLLDELAAGEQDRQRSVFLVGDQKQSIYQFRRANPDLFFRASQWLTQHLDAVSCGLSVSRRSSPAIIDAVNLIFDNKNRKTQLSGFETHIAHNTDLWGAVTLLTVLKRPDIPAAISFRNPLKEPRLETQDLHFKNEANQIAAEISRLISERITIKDQDGIRLIDYSDIIILLRKRARVSHIEQALVEHNIPFLSANKGTLLKCLEIQDLCALLETILSPYNNLNLAQVLRSPLYNVKESDLLLLATRDKADSQAEDPGGDHRWFERLESLAPKLDKVSPLFLAWKQIRQWRQLAGTIPVHDLLDHIYDHAKVLECYEQKFPVLLRSRVRTNFAKFIDLALELDGGRYPSLPNFMQHISALRSSQNDAPDIPPAGEHDNRVSVMTIHAAKGLEAAVVFIADSTNTGTKNDSYDVIVRWPAANDRPTDFLATALKNTNIEWIEAIRDERSLAQQQEEMNLLYVALTRAKQYLYLSGTMPTGNKKEPNLGWYGIIQDSIKHQCEKEDNGIAMHYNEPQAVTTPPQKTSPCKSPLSEIELQALLTATNNPESNIISPSAAEPGTEDETTMDDDAQVRGITIHRMLEIITTQSPLSLQDVINLILKDHSLCQDSDTLSLFYHEVLSVLKAADLQLYFDATLFDRAYNEITINFKHNQQTVIGVVDRIVVTQDTVYIIDYKTHQSAHANLATLCQHYKRQLTLYSLGAQKLWPQHQIKAILIFTAIAQAVELEL